MKLFSTLSQTGYSVFSFGELAHFIKHSSHPNLASKIHYYIKKGYLFGVHRGFYSLQKDFDHFELANKIFKPSYISLQSALRYHGIVFQHEETITLISYKTQQIIVGNTTYSYRVIKEKTRNNQAGIIHTHTFSIASPERAILDTLYLSGEYYFDNLSGVDWSAAEKLLPIYNSKILTERFSFLKKTYDQSESI